MKMGQAKNIELEREFSLNEQITDYQAEDLYLEEALEEARKGDEAEEADWHLGE